MNEVQRWFIEETRLGIPVDFSNEGIRGLCYTSATNFPAAVGIGATWNPVLAAEVGMVTGREARSLGYTSVYSPVLDVARDPRWGRVVECYGEDPFLVSIMGSAQATGLRGSGVVPTAKHFAVYSVPKGGRDGEARTDPHIARREMENVYMAPFAAAIRDGGLLAVMSSYNDYDGIPVSASHELLIDQLRTQIGFRGYVVSDSGAVKDLVTKHRIANTFEEAAGLFIANGGNVCTDFEFPDKFIESLRNLVQSGNLAESVIDQRVRDVLRVKFLAGLFDCPYVMRPSDADSVVHCEEHANLALRAARQSMVLLKNESQTLPLSKNLKRILVCGPNAKDIGHSISRYGPTGGKVLSVLDGIRNAVSPETEVLYSRGCEITDERWPESELFYTPPQGRDAEMIKEAVSMANSADAVICVLGESELTIGESKSRTDLNLTGYQDELVQALQQTEKPIIVVLLCGRALTINWIDRYIPAVLAAWFPGEHCGRAIADVIFGDYSPGGKLPVTIPKTVGQIPFNFPFKSGSQAGPGKGHNPNGIGNSQIVGELYPFGHGLSYTAFEYTDLAITPLQMLPQDTVSVTCTVTNTGQMRGDEVVQLYVRDNVSSVTTYDTVLRGFHRLTLNPGEARQVAFTLHPDDLKLINVQMQHVVEPGTFTILVGSSSQDIRLTGTFEVRASDTTGLEEPGAAFPVAEMR